MVAVSPRIRKFFRVAIAAAIILVGWVIGVWIREPFLGLLGGSWAAMLFVEVGKRLAKRVPRGCCPVCTYDLTGNVSGRCPECGTPFEVYARSGLDRSVRTIHPIRMPPQSRTFRTDARR
jgi:hypothetical protein